MNLQSRATRAQRSQDRRDSIRGRRLDDAHPHHPGIATVQRFHLTLQLVEPAENLRRSLLDRPAGLSQRDTLPHTLEHANAEIALQLLDVQCDGGLRVAEDS